MAKQTKESATVIPFPRHLAGLPRSDAEFGRQIPTRKGTIEVYRGDNGMVLIDACVPMAVAARMLAGAGHQVS